MRQKRNPLNQARLEQKIYRRRKISAQKKAAKNREFNSLSQGELISKKNVESIQNNALQVVIPKDFTLLNNLEGTLGLIRYCKDYVMSSFKNVIFKFEDVEMIGNGAITLLISLIGEMLEAGVKVGGTLPNNQKARDFFINSGFYEYFNKDLSQVSKNKNAIVTHGTDKTGANKTAPLVRRAMETVFGRNERNQKIQGMLVELMANTVNHAFITEGHHKSWYLSVNHEDHKNKVSFSFVDNGVGILSTIRVKFADRLSNMTLFGSDADILKESFNGEFGSRTREINRGMGLPVVRKTYENGYISDLKVITNNVFLDFKHNKTVLLKTPFSGTFYYWELDISCKRINF
jgi:hypothetical protein